MTDKTTDKTTAKSATKPATTTNAVATEGSAEVSTKGKGGRPKGSPNKMTAQNRERLSEIFDMLSNVIENDYIKNSAKLKELPARDLFDLYTKILPYVVPRLDMSSISGNSFIAERVKEVTRLIVSGNDD